MSVFAEGHTPDGTHVKVIEGEGDPPKRPTFYRFRVLIDGEDATVVDAGRYRDGGSTYVETEAGKFFGNRKLNTDRWDSWNGERLLPDGETPKEAE